MVLIDKKTGIIEAGDGWSIKMASHSLDIFSDNESYSLSLEIVDRGLKVVIFDDLAQKGVGAEKVKKVLAVVTKSLTDMGLIIEIE